MAADVPGSGASVAFVPASRWRLAAAMAIDYMAFGVLWAVGVHFLVVGPPPSGWIVPPIFLAFEWTLIRHGGTPGTRALALRRSRIGRGPGRPDGHGIFAWTSPAERLRRENALSVIAGLLFLAEGFHLWAAALGGGDLPPGFWAVRREIGLAAILLWGGLLLRVGWDFLQLRPRARVMGVFALLVTIAAVSFWPGAWGAAFVDALAAHRAAVGDPLPLAQAIWAHTWFPVAVWMVCAVAAVAVTLNRAPFRPTRVSPEVGRAQERRDTPRYDMPVQRAAQATALVMLLGALAGWSFVAWADAWGARQDRDSRRLVETVLPRIAAKWDPAALATVAGDSLKTALETDVGRAAFARYARLGALESLDDISGESVIRFLPEGKEVTAHYAVEARFAEGPAHLDVLLLRQGDRWTITYFQVVSPALARRP